MKYIFKSGPLLAVLMLISLPAYAQNINAWQNQSLIAQQVIAENFVPQKSAQIAVSAASSSVTFTGLTGTLHTTFKITNKGTSGAYIAWGVGSATAVVSTSTPAANCDYIPAGAVEVLDFQASTGIVNTIAAIQDAAPTTLEISMGFGN